MYDYGCYRRVHLNVTTKAKISIEMSAVQMSTVLQSFDRNVNIATIYNTTIPHISSIREDNLS